MSGPRTILQAFAFVPKNAIRIELCLRPSNGKTAQTATVGVTARTLDRRS
jgi:hypothetical protein